MEVIKEYPDIKIVGEQSGAWICMPAMKAAADLLQANPDVKGIYARMICDGHGVLQALSETRQKMVPLW